MAFGLDSTGFTKKKLSDILTEIETDLTEKLGPIDTSPESVFGQIIGVFADREASIWDLAEESYMAKYVNSADGSQLDAVASIVGITRQGATASTSYLMFLGAPTTVIVEGSLFQQSGSSQQFELDNGGSPTTIDSLNSAGVILSVNNVLDLTSYNFTLNSPLPVPYSFISGSGATATSILQGLANDVQLLSPGLYRTVVANETLLIQRIDSLDGLQTTFTLTAVDPNLTIESYGTEGSVKAVTLGSVSIPAHTINAIITGVSGLDSVDNAVAGNTGENKETDVDFRARIKSSTQIAGAGTVPAIEARLVDDISFISAVIVLENRTDAVDLNGLPPHSFEAIINSSDESPTAKNIIATELFTIKPAGIQTFGNQSGIHEDSQGVNQTLYFSFTEQIYVYLDISYTLYSEELFPVDGEARIKTAVAQAGNEMAESGLDVIIQRLYNAVFSVPGIQSVDIMKTAGRLFVTGGPSGEGQPSDITTVASSNIDGLAPGQLVDSTALFTASVERMMWAKNDDTGVYSLITGPTTLPSDIPVNSDTNLNLAQDIFTFIGQSYFVGGFADNQNLPISSRQIAVYHPDRIAVAETP